MNRYAYMHLHPHIQASRNRSNVIWKGKLRPNLSCNIRIKLLNGLGEESACNGVNSTRLSQEMRTVEVVVQNEPSHD
jgi:hypothetical protein